jgi:hypothetical protein
MKAAYTTNVMLVVWLTATLYWTYAHRVHSLTPYDCHFKCCFSNINNINKNMHHITLLHLNRPTHKNKGKEISTIENTLLNKLYIFFLATSSLQAPLAHKWNRDFSRVKRRTSIAT